jgi:hypothetical protein
VNPYQHAKMLVSGTKSVGKGIGKGASAIGKAGKGIGQGLGKVGGAIGKLGIGIGKQVLANYLGPGNQAIAPQALSIREGGGGLSLKSPIVLGGAAVLGLGALYMVSRKR